MTSVSPPEELLTVQTPAGRSTATYETELPGPPPGEPPPFYEQQRPPPPPMIPSLGAFTTLIYGQPPPPTGPPPGATSSAVYAQLAPPPPTGPPTIKALVSSWSIPKDEESVPAKPMKKIEVISVWILL